MQLSPKKKPRKRKISSFIHSLLSTHHSGRWGNRFINYNNFFHLPQNVYPATEEKHWS